ncbi:MAG: hypothetical protein HC773_31860 [Scytonema sp. CRU_2_7]|nr:hypothetical protein [Scytonema sp. CRU_2_7]
MAKSDSVVNETVKGILKIGRKTAIAKNWSDPCYGDRPNTDTITKIPQAV